jgi:TonB family protein
VAGVGGSDLTQRIEHIMTRPTTNPFTVSSRLLLAGVGVLVTSAPLATGVLNAQRGIPAATDAATISVAGPVAVLPSLPAPVSPAAAQDTRKVYRAGDDITLPKLVYEVKPVYTDEAKHAQIQGGVTLEAVVLENGTVGDVQVIRSLDAVHGLDKEAVKALKQWRFEPGKKDGKPVPVRVEVEMTFTLK